MADTFRLSFEAGVLSISEPLSLALRHLHIATKLSNQ